MYLNTYFVYDPQSPMFRAVANSFWAIYSKEESTWRDQLMWSWVLFKHGVTPLKLSTHVRTVPTLVYKACLYQRLYQLFVVVKFSTKMMDGARWRLTQVLSTTWR